MNKFSPEHTLVKLLNFESIATAKLNEEWHMGLMIHSLENIPESARRNYFIYLLDYGWDEPISEALRRNFDNMASEAAVNKAVVIKGTVGSHFQKEVFSWHQINGMNAEEILPALLISNNHPSYFQKNSHGDRWGDGLL
ncbi:hypothetical protein [Rhizobium sp.]|uniref:hypothetical protein n=1 Tax=Rhizobium sp. TaxID=391 RepID=UPI002AA6935B